MCHVLPLRSPNTYAAVVRHLANFATSYQPRLGAYFPEDSDARESGFRADHRHISTPAFNRLSRYIHRPAPPPLGRPMRRKWDVRPSIEADCTLWLWLGSLAGFTQAGYEKSGFGQNSSATNV